MRILFLHGWQSIPGGVKPTYLAQPGHEVINPALDDNDFDAALRTSQAEFDRHQPDVIVGSSRGGAVAMNLNSGDTPLVLLCPAWKKYGSAKATKPQTTILHSRADDGVPFSDSEELLANSGLPASALIEVGTDHRLADPEPLEAMLRACGENRRGRRLKMHRVLVIVPCGQKKIWDRTPGAGPTAAKDAYIGPPFGINKAYADRFGEAWVILSAKYGFIEPGFEVAGPYNVTFKKKASGPIAAARLREQVQERQLDRFTIIIGLGGKEYRDAIELAFAGTTPELHFPFSGLPIGKAMQATKRAIATNDPTWARRAIQ